MTQTHEPGPGTGPAGVDRAHLRSYEQLRRSTTDRKIAGVAGGLGRHLDIDPTILRVVLVVLCFFGGAGFLLYGVAWLLVPEEGRETGKIATAPGTRNALLIGTGVLAALLVLGDSVHGLGFPWPVLLVGIGVLIYLAVRGKPAPTAAPPPAAGPQPPWEPAEPSAPWEPGAAAGPAGAGPVPPWAPAPTPPPYRPSRRRGPLLFGPTLALLALALGGLGLYDALGGPVATAAYPALALAVVGLMLVVGSFLGRAGGLILLGFLAAGALAGTSVSSAAGDFDHNGQRVNAAPRSAAAVNDSYFVPTGRIVLDLSDVRDPGRLAGRSIDVGARAGELVVVLPRTVPVDLTADISGPGQIDLPDRTAGGFANHAEDSFRGAAAGGSAGTDLELHTHLFAGHIEVRNP